MKFFGVKVSEDVLEIIDVALVRDREMTKGRLVREAVREWAVKRGIEVPA